MISIISTIIDGRAQARILASNKVTGFDKPKGAVKTIESYETGEVIDCVDIFKQPAFDHPLLKNHTMQMKPSSNRKANGAGYVEGAFSQAWWKYGECPEGTIPIKRPQNHTNHHVTPMIPHVKRLNLSGNDFSAPYRHEYAVAFMQGGNLMGGHARFSVWNPTVMDSEISFSQIWLGSGPDENVNTVEAGWMVNRKRRSDSTEAEIFIYWTSDGYKKTGCYNLECDGFVQTNKKIALGGLIRPVSTYGGQPYDLTIDITKNDFTGWWWLRILDIEVGYWPREIFTYLKGPADRVIWGGEIASNKPGGSHTATQMGSGHFPYEGFGKASYFRNLKVVDDRFIERDPENLGKGVTRPECYDLLHNADSPDFGVNFYYGGPGFSTQCANW
ncbi:uncharacterized protein LOC115663166 [Syzygium oleosum]|uniref:uncharacterized protein LOC115663166 n=1 Tax=Syzygium oleosum TaxID=219896 RepID=UPI0024B8CC2E|nr:uncharacterized protein LOC115663166 [Syzygium oleosum]